MSLIRGLIIGKFMPPHRGHDFLIRTAAAQVDLLTIIVFTKRNEPIPGDLRVAWMREIYPELTVLHCADEHRVDYQDEEAWAHWIASIRRLYPAGPELVFSSEGYGTELARRLGAQHVLVDAERRTVPISATQVRERPSEYWDDLAPCVRAYVAARINKTVVS